MSRYSQGVLARKLVNRPCRPGVSSPRRRRSARLTACSASRPSVAAVLDHDLEAAGGAQAVDRRRAEDVDQRRRATSSCERRLQPRGDGVGRTGRGRGGGGSRRASRTSSRSSARWRSSRIDWPGDRHRVLDARRLARRSPRSGRITCSVRSTEARVGQLHVDQQVALVLRGMKPVGVCGEAVVGQVQQPAVDRSARARLTRSSPPTIAVYAAGGRVEAQVEQPEEPAEQPVEQPARRASPPRPRRARRPSRPRHIVRRDRPEVRSSARRRGTGSRAQPPARTIGRAAAAASVLCPWSRGLQQQRRQRRAERQRVERRDDASRRRSSARTGGRTGR